MNPHLNVEPEFNSQCAFAVSLGKYDVKGKAKHKIIENGKHYYFSSLIARLLWQIIPGRKQKAEINWKVYSE